MNRAMINKGLETTQHLMLLQVSCVSSNHQASQIHLFVTYLFRFIIKFVFCDKLFN